MVVVVGGSPDREAPAGGVADVAQSAEFDGVTVGQDGGEPITGVLTEAPGNGAAIGGLKVTTANAWFAARPSGTEDVYKIYAESFLGPEHLARVQAEAQKLVDDFEAAIERAQKAYDDAESVMAVTTSGGEIGYIAPTVGRTLGPVFDTDWPASTE